MSSFFTSPLTIIKLLLPFYLLIISPAGYTQSKKMVQPDNFSYTAGNNYNQVVLTSMQQVDSIAHAAGTASHFGWVYGRIMKNIEAQMQTADSGAKMFIKKFEMGFAGYFMDACKAEKNGNFSSAPLWKCHFSSADAQPWQLVLLGVNAHVNGDMWQALVNTFSANDIRRYKKQFLALQLSVAKEYYPFFDSVMAENGYLRFINAFSKGLAKKCGERLVYKWRRRQVYLAIMFYHDPEKFRKRLAVINRKKQKIDQLILRK